MSEPVHGHSPKRCHAVLVPGFCGFDALGQVEYYADVTPFLASSHGRGRLVLHYFDNFPTAAVQTRAQRLEAYLAKRIARGEFQHSDTVVLIGHSTGGLDIRQMIWRLVEDPHRVIAVDGATHLAHEVEASELLAFIGGLVFLSVPQQGTNIADWTRSHPVERRLVIAELRTVVAAAQVPVIDRLAAMIATAAARLTGSHFLLAARDSLTEIVPGPEADPGRVAETQEWATKLSLWLRFVASDFSAIDDLTSVPLDGLPLSPAHLGEERRADEVRLWRAFNIRTRSYATLGRRPFYFDGPSAPTWDLLKVWTYPEFTPRDGLNRSADLGYRMAYRACAGGPLCLPVPPASMPMPRCLNHRMQRVIDHWCMATPLEVWDNDGIVNTVSMLWPDGPDTVLVPGDHFDIVGHYRLGHAAPGTGRVYHSYDLFHSGSGFTRQAFEDVWRDVFEFCLSVGGCGAPGQALSVEVHEAALG